MIIFAYCIFHGMFVLPREKRTLDDFRRWKVLELKEFLQNGGLETTGTKEELTALAFDAVKLTTKEEIIQNKKKYQSLLNVND